MILLSQLDSIRFPYPELRRLTEFAFGEVPHNLVAVRLYPTYTGLYSGRTYNGIPRMRGFVSARAMRYYVAVGLNPDNWYPFDVKETAGGLMRMEFRSWQELLVAAVAHEAYHVQQFGRKGAASRHEEAGAERFAAMRLEASRTIRARELKKE